MAFQAKDGFKSTNRAPMRQHERSMAAKGGGGGLMEKTDPLAQPGGGEEQEMDPNDKPSHTMHHAEGGHTTVHESGAEKHHATAAELVAHLQKYLPEEEQEIADDSEPEYE